MTITESDWEHFKKIRLIALDRYCTAILEEATRACVSDEGGAYERYQALSGLIEKCNTNMKFPFDVLNRKRAPAQIKVMYDMGLVTDQDMLGFQRVGMHV